MNKQKDPDGKQTKNLLLSQCIKSTQVPEIYFFFPKHKQRNYLINP